MTPQAEGPDARRPPDVEGIFATLAAHDVDYVVVGGLAVQTHGHMRTTFDIDIYPGPTPDNLGRLADALRALEARALNPGSEEIDISAAMLPRATLWQFDSRDGAIDVLHDAPGAPPYEELRAGALVIHAFGVAAGGVQNVGDAFCLLEHLLHLSADGRIIDINMRDLMIGDGENLAAELLAAGVLPFRRTPVSGAPRNPFCMMGACFDCLVLIDGITRQACMLEVTEGMEIAMPGKAADA